MNKLITKNKKAFFDYEIINSREAGLELKGYETKSIRNGLVNLKGSFVIFINNEAFLKNMHISAWKSLANKENINILRERKIFLHKKTINFLITKSKEAGFSITPLELYFVGSLIKVKIALVKGKKQYEKKQILKERAMEKSANIALKKYN